MIIKIFMSVYMLIAVIKVISMIFVKKCLVRNSSSESIEEIESFLNHNQGHYFIIIPVYKEQNIIKRTFKFYENLLNLSHCNGLQVLFVCTEREKNSLEVLVKWYAVN